MIGTDVQARWQGVGVLSTGLACLQLNLLVAFP